MPSKLYARCLNRSFSNGKGSKAT